MSNLQITYTRILNQLQQLDSNDNYLNQRKSPKLSDQQLIALNLAAECLGIDSERYLFKRLPSSLEGLIERSVYNRRKRKLNFKIEQLRTQIAQQLVGGERYQIIDSMPIEVCRFSRAKRCQFGKDEFETAPDYGYCAAQKSTYFGYKLHAVCSVQGVFQTLDISEASKHDIHYLNDIKDYFSNCVLIGDRAYLSQHVQQHLFETSTVDLQTPMRRNQRDYQPFNKTFRKVRKRIETLYSQLCDQFMIRRNYAKSFEGLATRILSKITALTMIQWINRLDGNPLNNLKIVPN